MKQNGKDLNEQGMDWWKRNIYKQFNWLVGNCFVDEESQSTFAYSFFNGRDPQTNSPPPWLVIWWKIISTTLYVKQSV